MVHFSLGIHFNSVYHAWRAWSAGARHAWRVWL